MIMMHQPKSFTYSFTDICCCFKRIQPFTFSGKKHRQRRLIWNKIAVSVKDVGGKKTAIGTMLSTKAKIKW